MSPQLLDIGHRTQQTCTHRQSSLLYVCPLRHVKKLIKTSDARHIISLMDANWDIPTPDQVLPSDHLKLIMSDAHHRHPGKIVPNKVHIERLINFVERWDRSSPLLIHCLAGISRSTAAAFITQCVLNPHCDEDKIAAQIRFASDLAAPNQIMISLADKALDRKGKMINAIKALPRAHRAKVGKAFTLSTDLD